MWFQANVAGVQSAEGVGGVDLPEGYYTAKIVKVDAETTQNGRNQVVFRLEVTSPGYEGAVRHNRLGVPQTQDDKVLMFWRAALLSVGYTPAQIDGGPVNFGPDLFVNRTCQFYYKPGNKETGVYEKLLFLSPETYQEKVRAHAQSHTASNGSAVAGQGGGLGMGGAPALGGGGLGGGGLGGGGLGGGAPAIGAGGINANLASTPGSAANALLGMIGKK